MSYLQGFLGDVDAPMTNTFVEGLLGEIAQLDNSHPQKAQAIVKLKNKLKKGIIPTNTLTAKGEFESRLHLLPANILADVQSGKLQIVDKVIYTNRSILTAQNADLMVNSDVAAPGVSNINNRKLEANQFFMLTEIVLLSGANATLAATAFGIPVSNILNGEFEMSIGSKLIIPRTSCQIFNTANRVNCLVGSYKLANPKMIPPQTEIKVSLYSAGANAATTNVSLSLVGAILEKN